MRTVFRKIPKFQFSATRIKHLNISGIGKPDFQFKASLSNNEIDVKNAGELQLAALISCENSVAYIAAHKLHLRITEIQFQNVKTSFDIAAQNSPNPPPNIFNEITMDVYVKGTSLTQN